MSVIMKLAVLVNALLGMTANASSHLRVHILSELVRPDVGEQCEWENKAIKCKSGSCLKNVNGIMVCQPTLKPKLGQQCKWKQVIDCDGNLICQANESGTMVCQQPTTNV